MSKVSVVLGDKLSGKFDVAQGEEIVYHAYKH